jgi:galactonate dehydratase
MLRVSELFERHGVAFSPHNPSGPIAHAASLHVSGVVNSLDWLEVQFAEAPLFDALVSGALPPLGNSSPLPMGPGLGVALERGMLTAHGETAASYGFGRAP